MSSNVAFVDGLLPGKVFSACRETIHPDKHYFQLFQSIELKASLRQIVYRKLTPILRSLPQH